MTFGLHPVTTLFERGTKCEYIHSKGNWPFFHMPYLAKSYDASVVSYSTSKLGVTFFFNHPVYGRPNRNAARGLRDRYFYSLECEFFVDVCLCYHNSNDTYYVRIKMMAFVPCV